MMKRLFLIAFLALLPSCNGIFPGIYDSGESDLVTGYGFIGYNPSDNSGKVYIDATDYTKWVYLDFHGRTAVIAGMSEEEALEPVLSQNITQSQMPINNQLITIIIKSKYY